MGVFLTSGGKWCFYGGNPDVSMRQQGLLVVYTLIIQWSHFNTVSWSAVNLTNKRRHFQSDAAAAAAGYLELTLSGDEVVWSLVALWDGESETDSGKKTEKDKGVNNYKSTWWSETQGPLTLISPLPSILFLHFQHRVISYSSQGLVWCQCSAKFLLCFWLKIFQCHWRLICVML